MAEDEQPTEISETFGALSFEFTLDDFGNSSLFEPTYYLPYRDNFFSLSNLDLYSRFHNGSYIDVTGNNDFHTKAYGKAEFVNPDCWSVSIETIDNRFLDIPTLDERKRHDTIIDLVIGRINEGVTKASYTDRSVERSPATFTSFRPLWNSQDFSIAHDFGVLGWDASVGVSHKELDSNPTDKPDVTYTKYQVSAEKEINDCALFRGDMLYNISDVEKIGDVTNVQLGASGRFMNALGVKNLVMATKFRWIDQDDNVARLHPAGNIFKAGLMAKYKPTRKSRLNFSWNLNKASKSRPNRDAINDAINFPGLEIKSQSNILENTQLTHTYRLGGEIDISDDLDFRADWKMIRRNSLDETDFFLPDSPSLLWNSEDINSYAIRYHPDKAPLANSDLELRWTTHNRKNSGRLSSDKDNHLTINWNGNLAPRFNAYAGWGMFRTSTDIESLMEFEQKGIEYGGGFDWDVDDHYLFYTEIWQYDVSGADGYDYTDYLVGLRYSPRDDWRFNLEYRFSDDEFADYDYIDSQLETLRLTVSYDF
jgi:opacity protein-like surface antigen